MLLQKHAQRPLKTFRFLADDFWPGHNYEKVIIIIWTCEISLYSSLRLKKQARLHSFLFGCKNKAVHTLWSTQYILLYIRLGCV